MLDPKTKNSVKAKAQVVMGSTQQYLQIAEIRDNVVVLKNGGLRAVFKTSSINFNLKSEVEQNAILYSYQGFLNSLEFPVQIVVRSKKLDIDEYVESLRDMGEKQTNPLLQRQTFEYIDYVQKLVEYADIMEKEFYVIVPYDPYRARKKTIVEKFMGFMKGKDTVADIKQRHREFEELRRGLNQRVNVVKSGLENCGLRVNQLTTQELIELFYKIYNPLTARNEKLTDINKVNVVTDEQLVEAEK